MAFFSWWRRNWGLGIFYFDAVAALLSLLRKTTGHYHNYTYPARYLWAGQDCYGIGFPGSPGAFFYSPGCALYFYGLFAWMPGLLGQIVYMSLSVVVLWTGLQRLLIVLRKELDFDLSTSPYRHLFWLMLASEALGGIIAVKIDVLIAGACCFAAAQIIEGRWVFRTLMVLGVITSWKLHPAALFGLLLIAPLFAGQWRGVLGFMVGFIVGILSPWLALKPAFALQVTRHWLSSLDMYVASDWLAPIFQHLYGLAARGLGIRVPIDIANRINLLVGLALAAGIAWYAWRSPQSRLAKNRLALPTLAALGLGSGYVVMFSPLIQSNSYITYFPLVLSVVVFAQLLKWPVRPIQFLLAICFVVISLVYSDFCPRPLYWKLYGWGIKPLGVLALWITLVYAMGGRGSVKPVRGRGS